MARRRVIDWKKAARSLKGAGYQKTLVWFGIMAAADDFGLTFWSPLDIGHYFLLKELNERKVSIKAIERIMDEFTSGTDPSAVSWDHSGQRFLAICKWQDYQRVYSPSNADCPCPPPEILAKLSQKTQALIQANFAKFTSFTGGQNGPELELEGELEGELELEGQTACDFCKPLPPKPSDLQILVKHCHDLYKKIRGVHPTFAKGQWLKILGDLLHQHGMETVKAVYAHYLASDDQFIIKRGYSIAQFRESFDGARDGLKRRSGNRSPSGEDAAAGWRNKRSKADAAKRD